MTIENSHIEPNWNLIAACVSGNASAEEQEQLRVWLAESIENKKIYQKAETIWQSTGQVNFTNISVNAAWNKVNQKAHILPSGNTKYLFLNFKYILRVAAILIIGFLGWWYIQDNVRLKTIHSKEISQVTLSDGSVVDLNKGSQLTFPKKFKGHSREVNLNGEAFFSVARMPDKPFIIHTSKADIKVLGTSFNVLTLANNNVEVVVKTGVVRVSATNFKTEQVLHKNECLMFDSKSGTMKKAVASDMNYLAWKTRIFEFHETELQQVFASIEKVYGVTISVKDSSINHCKLTATYNQLQLNEIIKMVELTFGLKANINGKNIDIIGGKCI